MMKEKKIQNKVADKKRGRKKSEERSVIEENKRKRKRGELR